jgi:hypothetical protein
MASVCRRHDVPGTGFLSRVFFFVRTHRGRELVVAVGLATAERLEIEVTIGSCDEARG